MRSRGRDRRNWSFEGASLLLTDVRARTERAVSEIERLEARATASSGGGSEGREVADAISRVVSEWVREMEALGVEVEGPWLVDFDCGSGAYCWRWPERQLSHFHEAGEDCSGRVRLQ